MALKYYKHKETGKVVKSLRGSPGPEYSEMLKAPNSKYMVLANPDTGRSKLKDQERVLTERARNHARENDLDDTIQLNRDNQFQVSTQLLNKKGERRTKMDDK